MLLARACLVVLSLTSRSFPQTRSSACALILMRRSGCAGAMDEAPPESIAPGAFPFVLLVHFVETCVLADPAAVHVDEYICMTLYSVRVV